MKTYDRLLLALTLFFALILAWGALTIPADAQEPAPKPKVQKRKRAPRLPDGCVVFTLPDGRDVFVCDAAHSEPSRSIPTQSIAAWYVTPESLTLKSWCEP